MTVFRTTLVSMGNNVGIEVPEEVVLGFDAGRRVPVRVTLNGHTYDSTIAVMGGRYLVPVAKANREAAGVAGGEEHEVTLVHDPAPRSVEVPDDLAAALTEASVRDSFDALSASRRKEHVRSVSEAKTEVTRQRRLTKVVDSLRQ